MKSKTLTLILKENDKIVDEVDIDTIDTDRDTAIEITAMFVKAMSNCGFENCDICETWIKKENCVTNITHSLHEDHVEICCKRCSNGS